MNDDVIPRGETSSFMRDLARLQYLQRDASAWLPHLTPKCVIPTNSRFGPISGGHFNPAVSCGLWAAGRFPANRIAP